MENFSNCPLMPSSKEKAPAYAHAGKNAAFLWNEWMDNRNKIDHGVLMILQNDLIVIDIDEEAYVKSYEEKFPVLNSTAIQQTRKGHHYFFKRSTKCDKLEFFDGARQFEENGDILPIDIKTKCSTGTGGCIAVCPSKNKSWITPLYNFDKETLPIIPDTIVDHFYALKRDKKGKTTVNNLVITKNTVSVPCSSSDAPQINVLNMKQIVVCDNHLRKIMMPTLDVNEVRQLVDMLSMERSREYSDWIAVLWCLQNTLVCYKLYRSKKFDEQAEDDKNNDFCFSQDEKGFKKDMYLIFEAFSAKCPEKFDRSTCMKIWCNHERDGLRVGSLHMWAQKDNPEAYKKFRMECLVKMVTKCMPQHDFVAQEFFNYVAEKYVYAGDKRWFFFDGFLWKEDKENIKLMQCLGKHFRKDVFKVYFHLNAEVNRLKCCVDVVSHDIERFEKEKNEEMKNFKIIEMNRLGVLRKNMFMEATKCNHLFNKLGDVCFMKNVLCALSLHLYDGDFVENLDSKPHLLAFNNGVWDFKSNSFRPSYPWDMVCKSVGYNYNPKINSEIAEKVDSYWKNIHPIEDQREYVIKTFARQLYGDKGSNLFHLHAGYKASASNGKSTFFEILEAALGEYVHKFGVEYITSKRGEAGKPMPEFEHWKGTRIIFCTEPTQDDKINSGVMKEYSGGEKLSYRLLNKSLINCFKPMFKMHLMCNNTPIIDGDDLGVQRRIRKVDYMSEFKDTDCVDESRHIFKKDEGLVENLLSNEDFRMEFLRKLLDNYDYDYEFPMPPTIKDSSKIFLHENDPVGGFIDEWIVKAPGKFLPMKTIKDSYRMSDFYTPKKAIDKNQVERHLRVDFLPMKCIEGKTHRNVFEGFEIVDPSTGFEGDEEY